MKKKRSVDVAIIGGGSAGLSAMREVRKATQDFVVINKEPGGTTCARSGCMPSKVFLQVANDYHRRELFLREGISGAEHLRANLPQIMRYVRSLRDYFVKGVLESIESLEGRYLRGTARFLSPTEIQVEDETIQTKRSIIAVGSDPILPKPWRELDSIWTSEEFFELEDFPTRMATIGLGPVGLEFGQALHRLGVEVTGVTLEKTLAGLTDPNIADYAERTFLKEFPIHVGHEASVKKMVDSDSLQIEFANQVIQVDGVLASLGRRPNLDSLGLKNLGVPHDERGIPLYNASTLQLQNFPIFIAGDANQYRPILHEASDEGSIAGFNSVQAKPECFSRRCPLAIVFTDPGIAMVGKPYAQLQDREFIVGEASFERQGKATIMGSRQGLVRIYAEPKNGKLLGAEMVAPHAEHLSHLLAWAVQQELTAAKVLQMPFYHPVLEEGLRSAFRDILKQVKNVYKGTELARCNTQAPNSLE